MGLFSDLMSKIFHGATSSTGDADRAREARPGTPPEAQPGATTDGSPSRTPATGTVDVAAILDQMAQSQAQRLDWRHSIVDLMKLVGMDSSLSARRELAADLHYSGNTSDTAAMNMWLHREVMKQLAANGGKVPHELLSH
jgi:Domain of unknown function (DUF3597)